MNARLEPLNITSFVGGLNQRRSQLTLADDESPDMLNVEVDPRGGFYTRKGWERWNATDITAASLWDPRSAKQHLLSTGTFNVYVTNRVSGEGTVWSADASGIFSDLEIPCNAGTHMADVTYWGDTVYVATGKNAADISGSPTKIDAGTPTALSDASTAYNDDYTTPVGGYMPFADFAEAHAGYIFVAGVKEGGVQYPNRLRWSHPDEPEDWATLDFLDINVGGGAITALLSFRDHLLIFKSDSVWALYGYDLDSWQLVQVSSAIGTRHPGTVTRSENAVYFFSSSDRGGVYAYVGESPVYISDKIREYAEQVQLPEDLWLEWTGRRLWMATPSDVLVFDPEVGNGAWVRHRPALGTMGPIVQRSDVNSEYPLACIKGDSGASCLVRLDYREDCQDLILQDADLNTLTDALTGEVLTDTLTGDQIVDGNPVIPNLEVVILVDDTGACLTTSTGLILTNGSAVDLGNGSAFSCYYRTRWYDAGWPERRKSWRRPRFLVRKPTQGVAVRADVYWDYDGSSPRRSRVGFFEPGGTKFWTTLGANTPEGFDWGDGTVWAGAQSGGAIERVGTGLGVNRSIQIQVSSDPSTPGAPWAVDGFVLKYLLRRFTT